MTVTTNHRAPKRKAKPSPTAPETRNPIPATAEAMLLSGIAVANYDVNTCLNPGSNTVIVVGPTAWLDPIADAAKRILPGTEHPDRVTLIAKGNGRAWSIDDFDPDAAELLVAGKQLVAITDDIRRLPSGLFRVADGVIRIERPTWAIIRAAAASVGLTTNETISDIDCNALEPSELRLACRPGGEDGSWVRRIRPPLGSGLDAEPVPDAPLERLTEAMVQRALSCLPEGVDTLKRPATAIVIEVPSAEWTKPLELAVLRLLDEKPEADDDDDNGWGRRKKKDVQPADRVWIVQDGTARDHRPDQGNDRVRNVLAHGGSVIGIAPAANVLPIDLVRTVDYRVRIPAPNSDLVRDIMGANNEAVSVITDMMCKVLAPGDYQTSLRAGETPDKWVARLTAIAQIRLGSSASGPSLDDMFGMDEAVGWGNALAKDLAEYGAGQLAWSEVDRGCLLFGPPGTGKTTYARALANTCRVPLVVGSLSEWQAAKDGCLGDYLKAMRATFDKARAAAPCILFIDELDGLGDREKFPERHRDYSTQVVNCFLELVDGLAGRDGVVIVGACNHPERLDKAITRSGRMDRGIRIGFPDQAGLAGIIRYHLGSELPDADLAPVARKAAGLTGADIERVARGARRRARTAGRSIAIDDLLAEFVGDSDIPAALLWRKAFHEAGHAVAYSLLFPGSVRHASLSTGDGGVGGVVYTVLPSILTWGEIRNQMTCLLAGRASENLMCQDGPSSGFGGPDESDFAKATAVAARLYITYGFDDNALVWRGQTREEVLTALNIDAALRHKVMDVLSDQYAAAADLLSRHRSAVRSVAAALVADGALVGREIDKIISETIALESKSHD